MDITIIIQQMLVLAAMMAVGYCLREKAWLHKDTYQILSRIVVNIFNPLLIIDGVINRELTEEASHVGATVVFVCIYFAVLFAAGLLFVPLLAKDREERKLYKLMLMFSNVGFMGIPVVTGIYGKGATIYVIFYMLGYNVLLYSYGLHVLRQGTARGAAHKTGQRAVEDIVQNTAAGEERIQPARKTPVCKELLKNICNSGVLASLLAIVLFAVKPPLPAFVKGFCSYMGGATIPLSMILIGFSLADTKWKQIFGNVRLLLFIVVKMLAIPIAAALLLHLCPVDAMTKGIFVLQLAMPVGSILALMAADNGLEGKTCTDGIVLSTLLSVATIPIVCLFV